MASPWTSTRRASTLFFTAGARRLGLRRAAGASPTGVARRAAGRDEAGGLRAGDVGAQEAARAAAEACRLADRAGLREHAAGAAPAQGARAAERRAGAQARDPKAGRRVRRDARRHSTEAASHSTLRRGDAGAAALHNRRGADARAGAADAGGLPHAGAALYRKSAAAAGDGRRAREGPAPRRDGGDVRGGGVAPRGHAINVVARAAAVHVQCYWRLSRLRRSSARRRSSGDGSVARLLAAKLRATKTTSVLLRSLGTLFLQRCGSGAGRLGRERRAARTVQALGRGGLGRGGARAARRRAGAAVPRAAGLRVQGRARSPRRDRARA